MKKYLKTFLIIIVTVATTAGISSVFAGSLTPPGNPASVMYTLSDIYEKLLDNSYSRSEGSQDFDTPETITPTFNSLKEIYEAIPTINPSIIKDGETIMGVTGTLSSGGGLLVTGQTSCWNSFGVLVDCEGTGQDGDFGMPISFTDNSDGTLADNATGLVWEKCTYGQIGVECSGDPSTTTWDEALLYCLSSETGGYTDWRLPNIKELLSLIDYSGDPPGFYYPFSQTGFYWSSTTSMFFLNGAWVYNNGFNALTESSKGTYYYTRCVR